MALDPTLVSTFKLEPHTESAISYRQSGSSVRFESKVATMLAHEIALDQPTTTARNFMHYAHVGTLQDHYENRPL